MKLQAPGDISAAARRVIETPRAWAANKTHHRLVHKLRAFVRPAPPLRLGIEQQAVFDLLEQTTSNVYVTGKAGTGKSVLLRYFVQNTQKSVIVVAPTGIAALNAGGQTIHSLFKLPLGVIDPHKVRIDSETCTILQQTDAIVFDEISMVRSDVLEAIHIKCRLARGNNLPFGGIQVIMFGDVYQLPPVTGSVHERDFLRRTFGGSHFFEASVVAYMQLETRELRHVYRQDDAEFLNILNGVRTGQCSPELLEHLNTRAVYSPPQPGITTLTGTNRAAQSINRHHLDMLKGRERTYHAIIDGHMNASSYPTDVALTLRVGAQVMILRNDVQSPKRWVNGTTAIVTKLGKEAIQVAIGRQRHTLVRETWDSITYSYNSETESLESNVTCTFSQFPVRLAWAITVHKSQGQTYEAAAIDLSDGAYAPGQAYVALSRCKYLEGIYLATPLRPSDIIVDTKAHGFMQHNQSTLGN